MTHGIKTGGVSADGGRKGGTTQTCSVGGNGKRSTVVTLVAALGLALALTGCRGLPGAAGSSDGAPQTSANIAQNARDQSNVPGQAYGGDVTYHFASSTPGEVSMALIEYARETGAALSDLTAALKATNGAPENVTITNRDVSGGDSENLGAGSGGSGAASGGSVDRP